MIVHLSLDCTVVVFTGFRELVFKLSDSGKINGILVIYDNDTDAPDHFSPAKECPNDMFGKYLSCVPVYNHTNPLSATRLIARGLFG